MWTRVSDLIINKSLTILHKSICTRKRSWMRSVDDMIYACLNILNKICYTLRYAKYIYKTKLNVIPWHHFLFVPYPAKLLIQFVWIPGCLWALILLGGVGEWKNGKKMYISLKLPIEHTTESAIKCTYYTRLEHAHTAVCTLQPNH